MLTIFSRGPSQDVVPKHWGCFGRHPSWLQSPASGTTVHHSQRVRKMRGWSEFVDYTLLPLSTIALSVSHCLPVSSDDYIFYRSGNTYKEETA